MSRLKLGLVICVLVVALAGLRMVALGGPAAQLPSGAPAAPSPGGAPGGDAEPLPWATVKPDPPLMGLGQDSSSEKVILLRVTKSTSEGADGGQAFTLVYGETRDAVGPSYGMYLVKEVVNRSRREKTEYAFASSSGNAYRFCIYDPLYLESKKEFVFKYGSAIGATDQYRLMTYKEGDAGAKVLVDFNGLRNSNVQMSPGGDSIAYIIGGDQAGPDHAYFPHPLELWVCNLNTAAKDMVARGDSLNNAYKWSDNAHLCYSETKGAGLRTSYIYSPGDRKSRRTGMRHKARAVTGTFAADLATAASLAEDSVVNGRIIPRPSRYRGGSLVIDRAHGVVLYATDTTPQAEVDRANRVNDRMMKVRYGVTACQLEPDAPVHCSEVGTGMVETYDYDIKVIPFCAEDHRVFAITRSFSKEYSPVRKPPNVQFPQEIVEIVSWVGQTPVTLWSRRSLMGLSLYPTHGGPVSMTFE